MLAPGMTLLPAFLTGTPMPDLGMPLLLAFLVWTPMPVLWITLLPAFLAGTPMPDLAMPALVWLFSSVSRVDADARARDDSSPGVPRVS
jgi:hypothetical protein